MKKTLLAAAALSVLAAPAFAAQDAAETPSEAAAQDVTVEDAQAFLEDAEARLEEMNEYASHVFWVQSNFINFDTNWLAAKVGAESTKLGVELANETKKYDDLDLPADLERKMQALKTGLTLPAPSTPGAAEELAEITTGLEAMYGEGKIELDGEMVPGNDLEAMMGTVRDPAKLEEIWTKWREISVPMKDDYARMVEIANEGATELGFDNLGMMWLSNYDMEPEEMRAEVERLYGQVAPLYEQLHCYVRAELNAEYGDDVQPASGPIRADLLGNMWAQEWGPIYDIVAPEGSADIGYDLTERLVANDYDAIKMVETGEAFFTSLGFEPLPETFWERSLFTKPEDREVVCHASAWDIDDQDDVRIKMCIKVNATDFQTVHHELGHNFYQHAYKAQDPIYRTGAHDGFHEAIGDMVALSITPQYLVDIGLIEESEIPPAEADIGLLLNQAMDKIAFLPFGYMIDQWRWDVFSGEITPEEYNAAWWDLREQYQGIVPPGERPADAFDPGAKYHIPGNTPYLRYFLARILQFQFHKAACEKAGWEGPLHRCSVYGSEEVGEAFNAMLEQGASQPWPDTLELFTGTRDMSAEPMVEYFEPLSAWLDEQNEGRTCGW